MTITIIPLIRVNATGWGSHLRYRLQRSAVREGERINCIVRKAQLLGVSCCHTMLAMSKIHSSVGTTGRGAHHVSSGVLTLFCKRLPG